jgi:hypothetical protein
LAERKLPGLDSNQDKENQNAFRQRRKIGADKRLGDPSGKLSLQLAQETCTLFVDPATDPDLARLAEAWPTLPLPIRSAMLTLLASVTGDAKR